MFTGIVQGTAELIAIEEKIDFRRHSLRLPPELLEGLAIGASVAHNGCCLTVTHINGDLVSFDLMRETLRLTNLGALQLGDRVNLERAARFGDEIGGHAMSGHIIGTSQLVDVLPSENNLQLWFALDPAWRKYVFAKGYIGIDGISLTIGEVDIDRFCVNLIPETLARTNIGTRKIGDRINIEIDPQTQAIVDTVERVMQERR
ncbi:MAG: riboflavin synthase subunit alpha [Chromatiales bacterium]|nr:riboflavin synthase subunit alpha [Gammaproteobacteria bacterium]MBW6476921.1 riboflavin synthase subunit alpha [Chromatiales bacterium]